MKLIPITALILALFLPASAFAMFSCEGSLTKEHFVDERKAVQKELQTKIYEYRKLEASGGKTPETKAKLDEMMASIQALKTKFQNLDSKYFPNTPVTAFGAACQDPRWLEQAKSVLAEKPDHLGKKWFVWLDKSTRKPTASNVQPSFNVMAE